MSKRRSHYEFSPQQISLLKRASKRAGLREYCFLVYGRVAKAYDTELLRVERLVRVPNRAARGEILHHVFGAADFERVKRKLRGTGLRFFGYLHQHIAWRAVPSEGDIKGYRSRTVIFIYSEIYDELRAFQIVKGNMGFMERGVVVQGKRARRTP